MYFRKSFLLFTSYFLILSGCATEYNMATQQQESLMFNTQKEIQLGEALSKQYEKEYKPVDDIALQGRINNLGQKIARVCDRKDILYHFKVVEEKDVNAISLPGGFIYLNMGLIDKAKDDNEIAGVIAHEVGHITAKHSMKRLQAIYGYSLLNIISAAAGSPELKQGIDLAFLQALTDYSQEDELLADKLAVKYTKKAGFAPEAVVSFLEKLKEIQQKEPLRPINYWRTHPYISQRIAAAKQEVFGQIEFRDYLNLDKEEKQFRQ